MITSQMGVSHNISFGNAHIAILLFDGTIDMLGLNVRGQCDTNLLKSTSKFKQAIQVSCGGMHTAILQHDGTVIFLGDNSFDQSNLNKLQLQSSKKSIKTKAIQVSCGEYHTAVIFDDQSIRLIGRNDDGQCKVNKLPKSSIDKYPVQVACGDSHTGVLQSDGTYSFIGDNTQGQCDKFMQEKKIEQNDSNMHNLNQQIEDVGNNGDILVYKNTNKINKQFQEVKLTGCNGWNNQLNTGSVNQKKLANKNIMTTSTPRIDFKSLQLTPKPGAKQIACGSKHSAIVQNDGTLSLFGYNGQGECATDKLPIEKHAIQVACGGRHTAVLYQDGTVKIIGQNGYGQCDHNLGTKVEEEEDKNVKKKQSQGEDVDKSVSKIKNDMGRWKVKDKRAVQVSCGFQTTAILQLDGSVLLIGANGNGQLNGDHVASCIN